MPTEDSPTARDRGPTDISKELIRVQNEDLDPDDFDDELPPLDNEYGNEEDFEDLEQDCPDIGDGDRKILNDRILGLVTMFQHIAQNPGQKHSQNAHIQKLKDLGSQALSCEKKATPKPPVASKPQIREKPKKHDNASSHARFALHKKLSFKIPEKKESAQATVRHKPSKSDV